MTYLYPDPRTGELVEGNARGFWAALDHEIHHGRAVQAKEHVKNLSGAEAEKRLRQTMGIAPDPDVIENDRIQKAIARGVAEALAKQQAQQQAQAPQAVTQSHAPVDVPQLVESMRRIQAAAAARGQPMQYQIPCTCSRQQPKAQTEVHEAKPKQHYGTATHDSCGSAQMISYAEAQKRLTRQLGIV